MESDTMKSMSTAVSPPPLRSRVVLYPGAHPDRGVSGVSVCVWGGGGVSRPGCSDTGKRETFEVKWVSPLDEALVNPGTHPGHDGLLSSAPGASDAYALQSKLSSLPSIPHSSV